MCTGFSIQRSFTCVLELFAIVRGLWTLNKDANNKSCWMLSISTTCREGCFCVKIRATLLLILQLSKGTQQGAKVALAAGRTEWTDADADHLNLQRPRHMMRAVHCKHSMVCICVFSHAAIGLMHECFACVSASGSRRLGWNRANRPGCKYLQVASLLL